MQDGHVLRVVGRSLHQHRNVQPRQSKRVGDGALVTEVWQRYDHAIDLVAIFLKQRRATLRLFVSFDRAVLAVFRAEDHAVHARLGERPHYFLAP